MRANNRLNMILVELDRVNEEKAVLQRRVEELQDEQADVQRKMDQDDAMKSVMNKNLNEDLRYEREVNDKLRDELKRLELERGHLVIQLREQDTTVEAYQKEQHELARDMQKKAEDVAELERVHFRTLEELAAVGSELEQLRAREEACGQEAAGYEQDVGQLVRDRDDLIFRMNELTNKYEDFIRAQDAEVGELSDHHRSLNKILTSKLLNGSLLKIASRVRRQTYKRIKAFAAGVTHHQATMRRCLRLCGAARESLAQQYFWRWYSRALSFLGEQGRIDNVVGQRVAARTRASFFYHWRQAYLASVRRFDRKAEGVRLWNVLFKRQNYLSTKVAFSRWKDKLDYHGEQRGELRRRLRQRLLGLLEQGFGRWRRFTRKTRERAQMDALKGEFARVRYLQHMFSSFKVTCLDLRSQQTIQRFKTWKGWRDAYRRRIFLGNAERAGSRLAQNYEQGLVIACFNALQLNVSMEKLQITAADLERERRARTEAEQQLRAEKHQQLERSRYKSARDVVRQLRSVLVSWFEHWKGYTFKHKDKVKSTFKMMVITWLRRFMGQAMQRWKKHCDFSAFETQFHEQQRTLLENSELDLQIRLLQEEQGKRAEKLSLRKLRKFQMSLKRLQHRIERRYFRRWRANADAKNDMFFASMKCSRKLYTRTMRARLGQWREGARQARIVEMLQRRLEHMTASFDSRLVERTYAAWVHFLEQKRVMTKALCRVGMALKGQNVGAAFRKWVEVKNFHRNREMQDTSMTMLNTSQVLLGHLGDRQDEFVRQQQEAERLYTKMIKQAERVMANFVVRCLNSTLGKGFYTWKDTVFEEQRRVNLVRRAFLSLVFSGQRAAFSKWRDFVKWAHKHAFRVEETRLKERIEDVNMSRLQENDLSATEISNLQIEVLRMQGNLDEFATRSGKQLEGIIKKRGKYLFCSKKRMVFDAWRDQAHNERTAYDRVARVFRKSARRVAFSQIRARAFEEGRALNHTLRLNRVWMKFAKGQLQAAFSRWRGATLAVVRTEFSSIENMRAQTQQMHNERVVGHKERVAVKAARTIANRQQYHIFFSWFHIIKAWRALRVRGGELATRLLQWRARCALHLWRARKRATTKRRLRTQRAVKFDCSARMRKGFYGIHDVAKGETNLAKLLQKIDRRVNHLAKFQAFHTIDRKCRHHAISQLRQRQHGERFLALGLAKIFRKRQREALHEVRTLALDQGGQRLKVRKMMLQCAHRAERQAFAKWLKQSRNLLMVEQVVYEGNTAMAHREHLVNEHVLKQFVNEQGYTLDEVARSTADTHARQQKVAHKYYSLLVERPDTFRTIAFHAWRKFVALRHSVRDKAALCLNLLSQNEAFKAFRTWKLCVFGSKRRLMRLRKEHLISRIIDNSRDVSLGEDLILQRGHAINHVTSEREILMQNYIAGQKIGLSCLRMFCHRSLQHAFNLWKRHLKQGSEAELRVEAKKLALSIDTVKENLDLLRDENLKLIDENEELRQASLDGIEIAMAVQELTKEREQLSVDLADRAVTIKRLLEENQNLTNTLQEVDKEMHRLKASVN